MAIVSHYDVQPVIDIFGAVQGRDLGGVARDIDADRRRGAQGSAARHRSSSIRGQIETMTSSFAGLLAGLALAIVLVYLLIVVNFQSWLDPFIIISALPAALAGIVWMLFLSHTTISVPALTGAIMCMGVATANSILVVSFAQGPAGARAWRRSTAALDAGFTRFRPVLMTALAMIIGMVPMALGFGEGGEQNAPLGRAVIGGLTLATVATLFFVPAVFALLHGDERRWRLNDRSGRILGNRDPAVAGPIVGGLLVLVVARSALAFCGISTPRAGARRGDEGDARARHSHRRGDPRRARRAAAGNRPARHDAGVHRRADLRAHERLPQAPPTSTSGRT